MNQHPKAKAAGITPGEWKVDYAQGIVDFEGCPIAYVHCPSSDIPSPYASIMADALNTMNTHGRTPAEMVEIIRELRICLTEAYRLLDANERHISGNNFTSLRMTDILTKTEDFR